jgi:hypothetical protein
VRLILKAAVANAVGIVLLYFVQLDLWWRSSCRLDTVPSCISHVASVTYFPFTKVTRLAGSGLPLTSPLTLDWFQVILVLLVVIDAYCLAQYFIGRSRSTPVSAS